MSVSSTLYFKKPDLYTVLRFQITPTAMAKYRVQLLVDTL